ncbi:MAG: hypothetical protein ISF22_08815 [Methanomassiliicoccus sp.]|nr:hypothetical protein [Methanomassiliicoccus sp.]
MTVIIGNVLVILFNHIHLVRAKGRAEEMVRPFSEENPSGSPGAVLFRRSADAYIGAFVAIMCIIFYLGLIQPQRFDVWDPARLDLWTDPGFLIAMMLSLALFVLPGLLFVLLYAGAFYIVTERSIVHIRGRKRKEMSWKRVTGISRYQMERECGIALMAGGERLQVPERLVGIQNFYEAAVQKLPLVLRGESGYEWIRSEVERPRVQERTSEAKRGRRLRMVGLTIAMLCWTPFLVLGPEMAVPALVAMVVLLIIGLAAAAWGMVRTEHFKFDRTFAGLNEDRGRDVVKAWLTSKGAKRFRNGEEGLVAILGDRGALGGTTTEVLERVIVNFSENGGGTTVKVVLEAASMLYGANADLHRAEGTLNEWDEWIKDLWKALEADAGPGNGPGTTTAAARPSAVGIE